MKRTTFFLSLLLLVNGCSWFLPAGDPPQGNILTNAQVKVTVAKRVSELSDYFISALTVALLENCPGARVQLMADNSSTNIAARILAETSGITGNSMTTGEAEWVVKSVVDGRELQIRLFHRDRQIWQEKLAFSFDAGLLRAP